MRSTTTTTTRGGEIAHSGPAPWRRAREEICFGSSDAAGGNLAGAPRSRPALPRGLRRLRAVRVTFLFLPFKRTLRGPERRLGYGSCRRAEGSEDEAPEECAT